MGRNIPEWEAIYASNCIPSRLWSYSPRAAGGPEDRSSLCERISLGRVACVVSLWPHHRSSLHCTPSMGGLMIDLVMVSPFPRQLSPKPESPHTMTMNRSLRQLLQFSEHHVHTRKLQDLPTLVSCLPGDGWLSLSWHPTPEDRSSVRVGRTLGRDLCRTRDVVFGLQILGQFMNRALRAASPTVINVVASEGHSDSIFADSRPRTQFLTTRSPSHTRSTLLQKACETLPANWPQRFHHIDSCTSLVTIEEVKQ